MLIIITYQNSIPSCEDRSVIGDKLLLEAHDLRVGLELGLGVNERLVGTGIYKKKVGSKEEY